MVWLTLGTTVGIVSPLILWRWRRSSRANPSNTAAGHPEHGDNPYAAVSVRAGLTACPAVSRITGRRFLESDAPELPLPDCKEKHCQCRYQYHQDRRSEEDRRNMFGTIHSLEERAVTNDRRVSNDRRRIRRSPAQKQKARPRAYFNDYQA